MAALVVWWRAARRRLAPLLFAEQPSCPPSPDFVIYNAGAFPANKYTQFMTSQTSIDLSLKHKEMVILGTMYAGEMKKGVFT